jgi:hypothetical protein
MLSFNHLGNLGRLANQMFQYASLKGIANHRGYDFCIPPKEVFGKKDINVRNDPCNIYNVFDLYDKNTIKLVQNTVLQERVHNFDEELFINCPDNVDLFGYYQTEKYFKHIENEIREDFKFDFSLYNKCSQFFNESFSSSEVISLHVRRGDYVVNPNHPLQELLYYEKALEKFDTNIPVIIFSDDHEWCKEQDLFKSDRFSISENNSTDFDLCLMSLCKYHIIANSSFSWWGAWLADSEQIIAPKKWFGGDCASKSVKDMKFGNWSWL